MQLLCHLQVNTRSSASWVMEGTISHPEIQLDLNNIFRHHVFILLFLLNTMRS